MRLGGERVTCKAIRPVAPILGDRNQLTRVFQNLLSNAIRYSPDDSDIIVEIGTREDGALVTVIDNGCGIASGDLPHLFRKYFRSNSAAKPTEGLGLGLYISKTIVESHGGKIWADSTPGEGSRFHVFVPVAKQAGEKSA